MSQAPGQKTGATITRKLADWYFGVAVVHSAIIGLRNSDWIAGVAVFALYCIIAWAIRRAWKRKYPD
ncbi:MAG: hypothetical protein AAFQ05_09975 [Pseudomonadota bacterium]